MTEWRKSSASGANGCVEVRSDPAGGVQVRHSTKGPDEILVFTAAEWAAFLAAAAAGEFDLVTEPTERNLT